MKELGLKLLRLISRVPIVFVWKRFTVNGNKRLNNRLV